MGLLNLGALYLSWMLAMRLIVLQYSIRGRVFLVATYLFLLVCTSTELKALDLHLITRKVSHSCKKDWRECKFIFPGFWLEVWLVGNGILISFGFIINIDHYLHNGKGEWGAVLQGKMIGFRSLLRREHRLYCSRWRWTAMETWEELGCNGSGHSCELGVMLFL